MKRDIELARNTQYDLMIIGGGIQGAVICYKAARRGLRVLLLDKGDFCGVSSANSLKILHGGLRYLQTLDFRRMRDSIRSRREIMAFAPHLVKPLPCIMPAYGHGLKGKEVMRFAMLLNDAISLDRNTGLPVNKHLPTGFLLSKQQCLEQVPGISGTHLHGASVWYDALANNTERLVLEYILQASEHGATCLNYANVEALDKNADQSIHAEVSDQPGDSHFTVSAANVINCAGAAFEDLIPGRGQAASPVRWARGLNIVVGKKLFSEGAVTIEEQMASEGRKRMLFMVPWREQYTMIGTHYIERDRKSALFPVNKNDILALVDEINTIYPPAELSFSDVSFYHAGLLPMQENEGTREGEIPKLCKESSIIDHGKHDGFANCYSIKGIKYTTAPQVADKVLKHIKLPTTERRGAEISGQTEQTGVPPLTQGDHHYLGQRYAHRSQRITPYVDAAPQWLDAEHTLTAGEVNYFIEEEMARHLSDVVFRRSALGTAQCPSLDVLHRVKQIMAEHLNWSEQRQLSELKQVLQRYEPLQIPTL